MGQDARVPPSRQELPQGKAPEATALKAKPEPKPKAVKEADSDGETADWRPTTLEELKASKGALVAYLFLKGKGKEEIAQEVGSAFELTAEHAAEIVRRITGRVRFVQRRFALVPPKWALTFRLRGPLATPGLFCFVRRRRETAAKNSEDRCLGGFPPLAAVALVRRAHARGRNLATSRPLAIRCLAVSPRGHGGLRQQRRAERNLAPKWKEPAEATEKPLASGSRGSILALVSLPWFKKLFQTAPNAESDTTLRRAEGGDPEAQFALGVHYGCVPGEAADFPQALGWYRRAAAQNHPLAAFNLGVMYAEGQGVARDQAEARRWLERAAAHGDAGGQYDLGIRCQRASLGHGGTAGAEARIEAYRWLRLAALQGYGHSDVACQQLSLGMTREEIQEGERRVAKNAPAPPTVTP